MREKVSSVRCLNYADLNKAHSPGCTDICGQTAVATNWEKEAIALVWRGANLRRSDVSGSYHQRIKLAERCKKCRWWLTETREPVAAKLVDIQSCARRERNALQLAKAAKVSRVVKLIDEVEDETDKGTWLVLEYVFTWISRHIRE